MLVMAQAASFWHSKSPLPSTSTNGRTTLLMMSLNMDGISGRNVRHGPGSLLDDLHLGMNKQLQGQQRAGTSSQEGIDSSITACNDVGLLGCHQNCRNPVITAQILHHL
jgi:hypothetical protein